MTHARARLAAVMAQPGGDVRFLIDTNVLIPLEPTQRANVEQQTARAATFVRLVSEQGHRLLLHPETRRDIDRDRDIERRQLRTLLASKYSTLAQPPTCDAIRSLVGSSSPAENNWVDDHLLAAVHANAVDYLVTEDGRMHRKARRLGVYERVLSIEDAVGLLETLADVRPLPPPSVELRPMHNISLDDPIFDSLRSDYQPNFDDWFTRGARAGREGWVVEAADGTYAALCLLKPHDDEYRLGGAVLKVSTFKVAGEHQGFRYGELLLKTLFDYVRSNNYDHAWVTVFDRHQLLIDLFEQFGFERLDAVTALGELVYKKSFRPTGTDLSRLANLDLHVRYGPPCVRFVEGKTFVVPIQPRFHRMLFPEYPEAEPTLFPPDPRPFGNALRKAYLCNSKIASVEPGSALLFYRSEDVRAITAVAVVDRVLRSQAAEEIARFVGQRTVYRDTEIRQLAASPVLAMLFRQDRLLEAPVDVAELASAGVLIRAPQSIMTIRNREAIEWLARKIGALC